MTNILAVYGLSMLLILSELVFPSALMGLLGIGGLTGSIIWAWRAEGWPTGLSLFVIAVVLVPAALVRAARNLTLRARLDGDGSIPTPGLHPGMEGTAATPLRPTGVALLNGQRMDVLTNGEPVDRGVQIRVVSVEGNRVVVAPVERRIV
ncbi:MAG: NfeD family protein [Planctomycetota bacterium]